MFVLILLALLALYFLIAYFCMREAIARKPRPDILRDETAPIPDYIKDDPRPEQGILWLRGMREKLQPLSITSADGLKLYGEFLPAENPRRVVLLFHGYRSSVYYDFSAVLQKYHEHGCHLILVHQRASGRSEGKYLGFGVLERHDCAAWAWAAQRIFGEEMPIYLDGISMGASTVLMAAQLDLPKNVHGILADCGFSTPREIIANTIKTRYHIPPGLIIDAMNFWFRFCAHYGMDDTSTIESVQKSDLPILVIHGEADHYVPCEMSIKLKKAAPRVELITVSGAGHGEAYIKESTRVEKALWDFFEKTGS